MKVGILALSAKAYGGDTYFRSSLPWLDRLGGDGEYYVFTRDNRYSSLPLTFGRVRLVDCGTHIGDSPLRRLVWEQAVLPRLVREAKADVLYTANNLGVLAAPCPNVIAIRNMEPLAAGVAGLPVRLRTRLRLLRALTKVSIRRAARIIAVSGFVRDFLSGLGVPARKIRLVYHGVDVADTPRGPGTVREASAEGFLFSAGKFVRYANLGTLIHGYRAMRGMGVGQPLLIAGGAWDTKYELEVRRLVTTLGLAENVRFLGYVSHERMLELLSSCELFIFPSTLEACPFTLLEAMACGAPILSSRAAPMPEFAGAAAGYFDPLNSEDLAERAVALLARPEDLGRLGQEARRRAQGYGWDRSVRSLVDVLRETVATA